MHLHAPKKKKKKISIKDALFDVGDDKSLGLDGYTSHFFKKSWETVGNDFMGAIQEFFASKSILKQINHTVIVLVPKSSHSPTVGDFRLIACYNIFYKVITKILENIIDHA